jgi:S1-C subfamily serine protease
MPEWIQWSNENWHHIVIPVAILVAFIIGGRWLRRIAYDRFDQWAKRTNRLGLVLFITKLYGPFLFWFVLLGIYVAAKASVLPPEVTGVISPVLLSLFVSSWIWIAISISGGITRLYLPKTRQYLTRVKAPQPPTGLVVNSLRVIFIVVGAAILLSIWKLPNLTGLLVLITAFTIGILALREASAGISKRLHLSHRTQRRMRGVAKVFLSLLVVAGIADIVRRIYLLASTGPHTTPDLIILFLEIGFVIWFITILRSPNYRQAKPSFKLVTALSIITVLILAFAGVQPLTDYKDATVQYLRTQATKVTEFYESRSSRGDITEIVGKVSPAIVRLETDDYVGTGMIINETGYVLTCDHVVENSQSVRVVLHGGGQYNAAVISRDKQKDLAIVKISATGIDFPTVKMGNPEELEIGQDIIVIGYSLGLEGETSLFKGVVSAFRSDAGINYVQTDAAVNPGCSGGPLLNLKGEAMGVVTFKMAGEAVEAMGFAVSIDEAKDFITQVLSGLEPGAKPQDGYHQDLDDGIFVIVNETRVANGMGELERNAFMDSLAEEHSKYMRNTGSVNHDNFDARADQIIYSVGASYIAENCAMGYNGANGFVQGWLSSPGHRENMLNPLFRKTGIGYSGDYVTQIFCN